MRSALTAILDAFAARDLVRAACCFAEDGVYREARKPALHGRGAIEDHFRHYDLGDGAWRFEVDDVLDSDEVACVIYRFGVREGDGEPWRERAGCAIVRFHKSGRIAEWREYEG